mgnify:CR=1 FL=1
MNKADGDDYEVEEEIIEEIEEEEELENVAEEGDPSAELESEEDDDDDVVVSIGEEAPPPEQDPAPSWVKDVRKQNRDLQRRNRELEARIQQPTEQIPVTLGNKPSLEELDYDTEKYESELTDWYERKRNVDEQDTQHRQAEEQQQQAWQQKLESYSEAKSKLKVRDYDEAEEVAQQLFNVVQQGVVLQGAENPALVIYALGKNPKKAKELANIDDPVKFAFAVAKLESQLKISNRKAATQPEKRVSSTASSSGTVDSTLERLRTEAEKSGNMDKVMAYKRQKKAAQN